MELLITGAWKAGAEQISKLRELGHTVHYMQHETGELPCEPEKVEGVVCNGLFLSHPIEMFTNLRFIQLTSAGYDRAPMEYIREHNIEIYNAGNAYSVPMAEFVLAGVLQLYKRMKTFWKQQEQHIWEKQRNLLELAGKTVCIVGCGNVGTECAKRFAAFDTRVIGVNRSKKESPWFEKILPLERLDEALSISDIVVLAVPAKKETVHMIDRERLKRMKPTAVLVNVGRGELVDTRALVEALESGTLGGAVLDVFEEEPLPENAPLWAFEHVVIAPHNSFFGDGIGERLEKVIDKNLGRG